jgi:Tfp pilus assembly protein PilN
VIDLDFIPEQYHETRSLKGAVRLRASLISAMIVFMVLWVVANQKRISAAQAMTVQVKSQETQVDTHLSKKAEMEQERARLEDGLTLLAILESKASPVVVLSDVSRRISDTVFLTDLVLTTPSAGRYAKTEKARESTKAQDTTQPPPAETVEPESQPLSAPQLVISGLATETPDVIQFSALLEESPLVSRVQMELKGIVVWGGRRGQGFKLTCDLHPEEKHPR